MTQQFYNFKNDVDDPPNLLTLDQIQALELDKDKNWFISIFRFNDEHKKIQDTKHSLKGIRDTITDVLVWDFDEEHNPEEARLRAVELCHRLVDDYNVEIENISTYFSGNKGFHVVVPLSRDITPAEFKRAVTLIAGDIKFDRTVTHANAILRLEHTRNQKSGLYKIPLTVLELDVFSIEQIKELAKAPRLDFEFTGNPTSFPDSLFLEPKKKEKLSLVSISEFDYSNPPKGWKKYKWAIAQGWFESGDRHNALMVLAATCRGLGYTKDQTYALCRSAVRSQSKRTGEDQFDKVELYKNIIDESVFADGWDGGQYGLSNPWLQAYCKEMGFDTSDKEAFAVSQLSDIEAEFVDYVKNIDKNTIHTGIRKLDEALPLTIGMNLGVIGAASSGKTAMALKILKNTSEAGVISVFASLDMRRNRLFEKLLYRVSGLSRTELYKKIHDNDAKDIFDQVKKEYANVYFYDRSCPTVDDIRTYINSVEEKTGNKVKLVMLDYFERVNADKSDETAASKEVAGKLQDLVNDLNICMITLVQPNKFSLSAGPDTPILNYTAIKGSSYLYQSFRSIISIWRPFFNPEWTQYDKFLQMAILKNDLGELAMFNFGWEGRQGEIWGLSDEEETELDRLMKMRKDSKEDSKEKSAWD